MKQRKLSPKPHIITVAYPSGTVKTLDAATERQARERILYVLHDNSGMGITAANRHANAVEVGAVYETDGFKFILEAVTS